MVRRHVNTRVTGRPDVNWLECFFQRFFGDGVDCALNLGCGFGDLEEHAFSFGMVRRFYSLDVSSAAVQHCRKRFAGRAAEFEVSDLNHAVLEPERFDAVFGASVLHHVSGLVHLLDEVKKCLLPGGWFVFDEYVGPSRFQWRPRQLEVINELLSALPRRYRRDLRSRCRYKRRVYPNPLDETSRDSPFEAVRSEEILPLVEARFDVISRRDYGGAILHPLLDGIAGNFRMDSGEDMRLLCRLLLLESELERAGVIGSDFTSVVARKA